MGRSLIGKRVFVASPGDVANERKLVGQIVDEFNATHGFDQGSAFFVRGWEQLSGTVQRPQQAINELALRDCDYVIMILGARWGSPPQEGAGYDSGTEEEFFEALRLLADVSFPMRDILILFKDSGAAPPTGDQARKVREFRDRLERSKTILYNVFDTEFTFGRYVRGALNQWAQDGIEPYSKVVTLPEPGIWDYVPAGRTTVDLLKLATSKAQEGLAVQAESLFEAASASGDIDALAAYAKFMRRAGRYARSIELNNRILSSPSLARESTPAAASRKAMALAGIGIVRRKVGELGASRQALEEALTEAERSGDADTQAYVSDNLAHTLGQLGDTSELNRVLERSERRRNDLSQGRRAASLINSARAQLRDRNRERALQIVHEAVAEIDEGIDLALYANAKALEARVNFELGDYEQCVHIARQSLAANEGAGNDDGVAICESLLARSYLALKDYANARMFADSSLKRALRSGNKVGEASGYWNLAQIQAAEGDATEVAELIESALSGAREAEAEPLQRAIGQWFERFIDAMSGAKR